MSRALLCLLCVLPLMAGCPGSLRKETPAYTPPKVDCAISDAPKSRAPDAPAATEKDVAIWQAAYAKLQEYALGLLGQRIDSAVCVGDLKDKGVVK